MSGGDTLEVELVTTRGGALAVRDRTTGEVMHSSVGPRAEAEALYVSASSLAARLEAVTDADLGPLVLLDVGLGAGSNAIGAWLASERAAPGARRLAITSFDRSTAALELALAAEHAEAFDLGGRAGDAARRLLADGAVETARTSWRVLVGELPERLSAVPDAAVDVVFWDPFSPRANPDLWTVAAFTALRRTCREGATVHTYSQATRVRSALLLAGFQVGIGASTGDKEATTVAGVGAPPSARLLDLRWLERLRRSSAPLPDDAPEDGLERIARLPQFHGT